MLSSTEDLCFAYSSGLVDAHAEVIRHRIRTTALVNPLVIDEALVRKLMKRVRQNGVGVMGTRARAGSSKVVHQLILFVKGSEGKARRLRKLLETRGKTVEIHREIGELLGYPETEIRRFLQRLPPTVAVTRFRQGR